MRQVAISTGYAHSGGGFRNALGALRTAGLIDGRDHLRITPEGRALGDWEPLPTGRALLDYWLSHGQIKKAEREVLVDPVRRLPARAYARGDRGGDRLRADRRRLPQRAWQAAHAGADPRPGRDQGERRLLPGRALGDLRVTWWQTALAVFVLVVVGLIWVVRSQRFKVTYRVRGAGGGSGERCPELPQLRLGTRLRPTGWAGGCSGLHRAFRTGMEMSRTPPSSIRSKIMGERRPAGRRAQHLVLLFGACDLTNTRR